MKRTTTSKASKTSKTPAKAVAKKAVAKKGVTAKSKPKTDSTLKVGQKAPAFKVSDESGQVLTLAALKGQKAVLYFYPKDMTPGCTTESCDFRDNFARLKKMKAIVFGISRDSVISHQKFKTKHELPFALLADVDGKMCEAYGVWKEKNNYGKKYMGIERTTVIIDENGKVANVYSKVSVKGHVDQIIKDLK